MKSAAPVPIKPISFECGCGKAGVTRKIDLKFAENKGLHVCITHHSAHTRTPQLTSVVWPYSPLSHRHHFLIIGKGFWKLSTTCVPASNVVPLQPGGASSLLTVPPCSHITTFCSDTNMGPFVLGKRCKKQMHFRGHPAETWAMRLQ